MQKNFRRGQRRLSVSGGKTGEKMEAQSSIEVMNIEFTIILLATKHLSSSSTHTSCQRECVCVHLSHRSEAS